MLPPAYTPTSINFVLAFSMNMNQIMSCRSILVHIVRLPE